MSGDSSVGPGRVAVVGAGVVGCAVAASLARSGVRVELLEARRPGAGTSSTTFGWVNANSKEPRSYHALNVAGVEEHHANAGRGSRAFHPSGHLEVAEDPEHVERLLARVERLQDWGYPAHLVGADHALEVVPDLQSTGTARAWFPQEGYCDVTRFVAESLRAVRRAGGVVRTGPVRGVDVDAVGVAVDLADGTRARFDRVVVAAGRWSGSLLATGGYTVPLQDSSSRPGSAEYGLVATTHPVPVLLDPVLTTSRLNARPDGHGRLLLQALDLDADAHPDMPTELRQRAAGEMAERLRTLFALPYTPDVGAEVGTRALPADGFTACGFVDPGERCYAAVTHSGVTLAPLLGRLAAEELLGSASPLLEEFRPSRFDGRDESSPLSPARRPGEQ